MCVSQAIRKVRGSDLVDDAASRCRLHANRCFGCQVTTLMHRPQSLGALWERDGMFQEQMLKRGTPASSLHLKHADSRSCSHRGLQEGEERHVSGLEHIEHQARCIGRGWSALLACFTPSSAHPQCRMQYSTSTIRTCVPINLQKSCPRLPLGFSSFLSSTPSPMDACSTRYASFIIALKRVPTAIG